MKRYHSFIGAVSAVLLLVTEPGFSQSHTAPKQEKKPAKRFRYFYEERAYPFDKIPEGARLKAFRYMENSMMSKKSAATILAAQPEWRAIGPFGVGGRVKSVIVHPANPDIAYIGTAAGGAWKTTNGGQNWTPIFDDENGIAFGSLALDPSNPDVLYAATGEPSSNIDAYLGAGVFKSMNGGTTWKLIGLTEVGAFSKIFVHPKNPGLVVAGATKGRGGFYKSTNGGTTWKRTFQQPVSDVTINPNNENEYFIGVDGVGVYYSNDGGETWALKNNGIPFTIGRVSIQQAASNPDVVYVLLESGGRGDDGIGEIFKTTNRGGTWVSVYKGQSGFFNGQGWYNNYIEVNPKDENHVIAGGIDIFRTKDGGKNWSNTTFYYSGGTVHADQHHAAFAPSNPNVIYAGNDGGMYKSTDGGQYWTPINNNLAITQFYDMAVDQSKDNINYGGTQDNGTLATSPADWDAIYGGDGFHVAINHDNPDIVYGEVNGSTANSVPWKLNRATGQSQQLTNGLPVATDAAYWSAPLVINPLDGESIFHGRTALYASYNGGAQWEAVSPARTSPIAAIGMSPIENGVIYTGTTTGSVHVTREGGYESWKDVSRNGLVNRFVKDISCSPFHGGTAFIAFGGYGTPHLFKTTD
ncbi:MAG TPA: hypothetical protein VEC36_01105, partial [Patescibacteria group bacterium]|nr:hypothetical protein [Patescibacteria group bacterium]